MSRCCGCGLVELISRRIERRLVCRHEMVGMDEIGVLALLAGGTFTINSPIGIETFIQSGGVR